MSSFFASKGFDVPAANVVICYDYMKDSVELCQRVGRARHHDSAIVILEERPDRPVSKLEAARQLQDTIVEEYNPQLVQVNEEDQRQRQSHREKTGYQSVLQQKHHRNGNPVAALNLFVKKTKSHLLEEFQRNMGDGGGYTCSLTYRSILRTIVVESKGSTKKGARNDCALKMLEVLTHEMSRIY